MSSRSVLVDDSTPKGIPSRDNVGRTCELVDDHDQDVPDHIQVCTCRTHTGVCASCNFKITVGNDGTEYGHARSVNRGTVPDEQRVDCEHRPNGAVDPRRQRDQSGGERGGA